MKIEDKIFDLSADRTNPNSVNELESIHKKYKISGNILFYLGIVGTIVSLISLIIFIIKMTTDKYFFLNSGSTKALITLIPFITLIIFSIMIFIGYLFKNIAKLAKTEKND